MSHTNQTEQHTQHNPPILTDEQIKQAAKDAEVAAKAQRKADRDAAKAKREEAAAAEVKRKRDEKDAKLLARQAVLEAEAKVKSDAREAKKAETARKREAKNAEKKAEALKAREAKREAKAVQKIIDDAARVAARAEADKQREADKAALAIARATEIIAEKKARKEYREQLAILIAKRKAENASPTGRRQRSHFIRFNGLEAAFSKPQEHSIRGKVLQTITESLSVGRFISVDLLAVLAKPVLYGQSVRSYLSKLEETNHIDFFVEIPHDADVVVAGIGDNHTDDKVAENADQSSVDGVDADE